MNVAAESLDISFLDHIWTLHMFGLSKLNNDESLSNDGKVDIFFHLRSSVTV